MKLKFLGTGTSLGVPIVGCHCGVCVSKDNKDKRMRCSSFVEVNGVKILIDCGPDFRSQMLNAQIDHIDAILLTHSHKDHTGGLDDLRCFNYIDKNAINIYCEYSVLQQLKAEYDYCFKEQRYPGVPELRFTIINEYNSFFIRKTNSPGNLVWVHDKGYHENIEGNIIQCSKNIINTKLLKQGDVEVIPIRGMHGSMPVLGFRIKDMAYITDINFLPKAELCKLKGLKCLTLNTVGYKPHHSHLSLDEAICLANTIGADITYLTHLSHTFPVHTTFKQQLNELCSTKKLNTYILPAYDGLELEI